MFGVLTCKILFLKISPLLYLPLFHRPTTERTPTEYLMTKKALFLKLIPKKVVSLPKKVDLFPNKVYSIFQLSLETFAYIVKKYYLCTRNESTPWDYVFKGGQLQT